MPVPWKLALTLFLMLLSVDRAHSQLASGRMSSLQNSHPEIVSMSPAPGESPVARTRETIVDFSVPLDPQSVNTESIFAEFFGSRDR